MELFFHSFRCKQGFQLINFYDIENCYVRYKKCYFTEHLEKWSLPECLPKKQATFLPEEINFSLSQDKNRIQEFPH